MTPAPPHALSGLLAFWAEAGVEFAYEDAPVDRLAEGARRLAEGARRLAPKPPPPAVATAPVAARTTLATHDAEAFDLARAAAASSADLPALEAAIAAFPWGGLKARAARTVFAGRSGQLLDRILAAAGLQDQVFITNTVFWRPSADRTPSQSEQAICLPFVERAIALVKPRVLLLAGGASAKHLLRRNEGILSLRGRWFDWTPEGGGGPIPALPILHPAFLLRQPAAKAHAWQDVLTLLSRLDQLT